MSTRITPFTLLVTALAVVMVTGCDMNLTANLYTVDLQEAMSGSSEVEALAQVEIEIPSADSCDEYTTKFTGILHGILDEISPRGCKRKGVESFLLLETRLPVLRRPKSVSGYPVWRSSNEAGQFHPH